MAFIECEIHGGDVALMASEKVCHAIYVEDRLLASDELELFWFALDLDIHLHFWVFKSEIRDINPVVADGASSEELEKNEWLLGLMKPRCVDCFNEHVKGET
jgi:hypothetical protein